MNLNKWISVILVLVWIPLASALEDTGKTRIGKVEVVVYYATNGDLKASGLKTSVVPAKIVERLAGEPQLRFKHYGMLGRDAQPLLRSYESWAEPLKPSAEVMVRFEAQGKPTRKTAVLDLELWLARKKILKTDVKLEGSRPLYILGPEYRGGRLIVAVGLASEA